MISGYPIESNWNQWANDAPNKVFNKTYNMLASSKQTNKQLFQFCNFFVLFKNAGKNKFLWLQDIFTDIVQHVANWLKSKHNCVFRNFSHQTFPKTSLPTFAG